jgi:hypothetical protein
MGTAINYPLPGEENLQAGYGIWETCPAVHMSTCYSYFLFYVQVTMHHDKLRIKQQTRCIKYPKLYFVMKLYMFWASSVPIIRSYLLYTRQLVCFMQVM